MSEMPTIVETGKNDNGWGGNAWGAGVGGFIGSMFGNGGFGGWGYGNRGVAPGQVGADVALQNGIQNLSNQVQQNGMTQLQAEGATQRQVADTGFAIQGGQYQQTIANLQGQNQQNLAMVQGFGNVGQQLCCLGKSIAQDIDQTGDQLNAAIQQNTVQGMQNTRDIGDKLCMTNQNITNQGYQNQLQTKDVLAAMAAQHADIRALIQNENCQDRELMREIATQGVRDKLAETQAELAAQKAQGNLTQQLQNQTLYFMQQMQQLFQQYKGATATAGA